MIKKRICEVLPFGQGARTTTTGIHANVNWLASIARQFKKNMIIAAFGLQPGWVIDSQ